MEKYVDGQDGRLYRLEMQNSDIKRLLYVPLEMRGRLVVAKHAAAVSGHQEAGETLAKLRKHYFWMFYEPGRQNVARAVRMSEEERREASTSG